MSIHHARLPLLFSLTALLTAAPVSAAQHWVSTWTASPQPIWSQDQLPLPTRIPAALDDRTVQQTLRISQGGDRVSVVISNEYGQQPLLIGAAQVALYEGDRPDAAAAKPLRFGGQTQVAIAAGEQRVSDPVDLPLPALSELRVSLYLPRHTALGTFHWDGKQTTLIAPGNQLGARRLQDPESLEARLFLSEVRVASAERPRAVVVLGDSLTDGNGSTLDANRRWPDFLAERLRESKVAVLNAGISGARLLQDGMGVSASKRFVRDVLSKPGVETVVLMLGINDISWPGSSFAPNAPLPSLEVLEAGYRQLIEQARQQGVRIVGATLLPFERALEGSMIEGYHSPEKEQLRQALNQWMRTSQAFDAVIDFDAILRDPQHPGRLLPAYDCGDHLHPGDAGNRAMAYGFELDTLLQ